MQGSKHFWFKQAKFATHSELTTHSGRQLGGDPTKFGKQEHTACPFISLHWLFAPHGDGLHGFCRISAKKFIDTYINTISI